MSPVIVAALYHFARLPDFAQLREPLHSVCEQSGIRGSLLLASEGINGTIAGSRTGIDAVLAFLRADPRFASLEHKESLASQMPFARLKIKLKHEIVTMGVPGVDPEHLVGTYVDPQDWNALIADPNVLVVDTRNAYEVKVGSFRNAVSPDTESFRQFPDYVARELRGQEQRPIAMFCTGGIRCEKATSYLRAQGFEKVYHLRGGILKYLEQVPEEQSLWDGECYVFDERVAVGHGLKPGQTRQCDACGQPLSPAEQASPDFDPGISCPHCIAQLTPQRRAVLEMRRAQQAAQHGSAPDCDD
ncbi:rhodanese-related sulfurtransferase [Sinimarinibacterium sp. CAU 1509]|uniref:oxygen-dependent tRNA uridine(34) hydroxylase TrhO n=1 Tax=Sinimarinibacterium sp. CAU 1509 TaxID=2562283 RepID=UPI0010AD9C1D|nr:rhodanese-related sulfurtransferase [Sinimarinibacterium sp. CAU 1509]TJY58247.1 rhodanese-related sulfurtransferase [Sinimarinibacterium sp. CAU 1509]